LREKIIRERNKSFQNGSAMKSLADVISCNAAGQMGLFALVAELKMNHGGLAEDISTVGIADERHPLPQERFFNEQKCR